MSINEKTDGVDLWKLYFLYQPWRERAQLVEREGRLSVRERETLRSESNDATYYFLYLIMCCQSSNLVVVAQSACVSKVLWYFIVRQSELAIIVHVYMIMWVCMGCYISCQFRLWQTGWKFLTRWCFHYHYMNKNSLVLCLSVWLSIPKQLCTNWDSCQRIFMQTPSG